MAQVTGNASRHLGDIVYSLVPVSTTTSPTERVGRYQLLEPIGIGPSGAVSRAKVFGVAGFERQFAVKRFHAELTATAAMAAMLSAAARAYGSLEHPRIARMSEFGVAQGSTFTAVEYVPGLDALRLIGEARLAGAALAAGGALALVSQAARAVGYAHGRGLTHLGLAPTNVIVTADGDIKITDFGILSATLPQRPIEVPRLAQRIPYLAPEQLANEATSAATDVFALGVLAYELVTGARTFKGDTPQQVASAIMAGPPGEPPLPRPIVRVLQRCLARSPVERFPDARALADARDAALRVAPVPGTRKDVGAQVKEALDRLAALNEGQMSGMVALHLGTGPIRRLDDDDVRRPGREPEAANESAQPYELARPDPPGGPASLGGATLSDLPRMPMTTVPGLAPPPIPVPPGLGPPAIPPPPGQPGASTLLGMGKAPPALPSIKGRPGSVSGIPPVPPAALRPASRPGTEPARPELTVESAVHPLDPSELEPMDSDGSADAGWTIPSTETDTAGLAAAAGDATGGTDDDVPAGDDAPDARPVPASADDFLDGPTHTLGDAAATNRPIGPGAPTTSYRLDPSSIDTRPIEPVTLEPSLFDPIVRPTDRPSPSPRPTARAATHRERVSDVEREADEREEAQAFEDLAGRASTVPSAVEPSAALPGSGRVPRPEPGAGEPRQGQTILGYAAPSSLPREVTPSPELPVPSLGPDRGSAAEPDPLSEMVLEGYRAVPTPDGPANWNEPSEIHTDAGSQSPLPPPEHAPPQSTPGWITAPPPPTGPLPVAPAAQPRPRALWILAGMVGAAIVGVTGWQVYERLIAPTDGGSGRITSRSGEATVHAPADATEVAAITVPDATQATPPADATQVAAVLPDARGSAAPPDAARVAAAPPDARAAPGDARPAPGDAAQVAAVPSAVPSAPGDSLAIASTPPGARVFLGGADVGVTPLELPGSPDRHNIALVLAGHELYVAKVDGHGTFQVPLKEVTPTNGPAGIKVLRCKDKERYYVFVDGKPTGQTCPTERIGCEVGPHTVEIYDAVSEERRKWEIVVKDTRLSFRVRVE